MRDIGEARLALDESASGPARSAIVATDPAGAASSSRAKRATWILAALNLLLAAGLVATLIAWAPWRAAPIPGPRRVLANIGTDASLTVGAGPSAILSPDGTTLALAAERAGQRRLFIRKLDQLQATPLAGTDGAANPFFSLDGQWIAFFGGGKLKKVAVSGGAVVTLCDATVGRGGAWIDDDTIVFTPSSGRDNPLMRVSSAGGASAAFGTLSPGATTQRWPQLLPGDAGVLATENATTVGQDAANLVVFPRQGGAAKIVLRGGYFGRYLPSGHLIYVQSDTVFAIRFDLTRLETVGQAVPVLEGVSASTTTGGAQLAFSPDGTLLYLPGTAGNLDRSLDWMTRDGKTSSLRPGKANWSNLRFSPDGQKAVLDISDGKQRDVWVYEWARDTLTQLTFGGGQNFYPVWTPDGWRIVFASDRAKAGVSNLYWMNADGTGEAVRLTDSPVTQLPNSWQPSGRFLAFDQNGGPPNGWDLMILPMDGDATRGWTPGKPTTFLATPATEINATFSPDGRWIAYQSNESNGTPDVYVRPFPGPGGMWRVSTEGGGSPRWSSKAPELPFRNQSHVLFAPYSVAGESFRADKPQPWSPTATASAPFDIHPDGRRLGVNAAADQAAVQDHVVFVFNFLDHLRTLLPAGTR